MIVHLFNNNQSPAVAIYGLGAREHEMNAEHFVKRDFYIDEELKSLPSTAKAIDLLKRMQEMLIASNLQTP